MGIGVAALVAINSFTDNLQDSVHQQARSLLGADLAFSSGRPIPDSIDTMIDSLVHRAGASAAEARGVDFDAMAYVTRTSGTRLVQVSANQPGYPFYGEITTDPAGAWRSLAQGGRVVVEPSLLSALGASLGDTLALGQSRFVIAGTTVRIPGDVGVRAAFGPRVFIAYADVAATGLLQFGSRATHQRYLRLPASSQPETIAQRLRPQLRGQGIRVHTVADDQAGLDRTLSRLADYLGLIALVALLLGGLGVASATFVYLRGKLDTVATLRCIGATAGDIFATFLIEAAAMGLVGSAAGAALGAAVQYALPGVLHDFLPVDVTTSVSWPAVVLGMGVGLWVALLFAALPLLEIRLVPPLAALRRDVSPIGRRDPWRWPAIAALAASVVVLASLQVGSWRSGAVFSLAIAVALGLLWAAARLLIWAVRRWFPRRLPYVWRQGLANLYRPANQTVTVVLALGFGAFLLATILVIQGALLRELRITGGPQRANLVLFDIQPDQVSPITSLLRQRQLPVRGPVPIVPMRIHSINGRLAAALMGDTTRPNGRERHGWAFRREYRSTYRDTVVSSERITAGAWWKGAVRDTISQISVENGVAGELGVGIGDTVTWDVQGQLVKTRITSLRDVDWARFEPNFFVVFQPGVLEPAPQTAVILTRVDAATERGAVQREVAERFSNVTTIDLTSVLGAVERLVSRVVLAIRFMALFTLAAGLFVLFGAVAGSRRQRVREGVLLRTIGATRAQVRRVIVAEYVALGTLAALTALLLAGTAGWALSHFMFDIAFSLPVLALLELAAGVVGLTVLVGVAGSRAVSTKAPLEVLRAGGE